MSPQASPVLLPSMSLNTGEVETAWFLQTGELSGPPPQSCSFIYVYVLACVYVHHVWAVPTEARERSASDPLELDLQIVLSA